MIEIARAPNAANGRSDHPGAARSLTKPRPNGTTRLCGVALDEHTALRLAASGVRRIVGFSIA
jgi:hypothetical protein